MVVIAASEMPCARNRARSASMPLARGSLGLGAWERRSGIWGSFSGTSTSILRRAAYHTLLGHLGAIRITLALSCRILYRTLCRITKGGKVSSRGNFSSTNRRRYYQCLWAAGLTSCPCRKIVYIYNIYT